MVHVEMTEKCNLACFMCDRNENGGDVNPYLEDRELTFKDIQKTFSPSFIKQLKKVYFCGNYGDPILANGFMKSLKYLKECNKNIKLSVITNGCSRPSYWWRELAEVVDMVRFGIDGLKDTHKIYRQGAIYDLIIRNAKSYIDAGGYAIWDYLVFGHNEHQIEKAREISKKMGFKEFIVKKTGRFFSNIKLKGKDKHQGIIKPKMEQNINKSLINVFKVSDEPKSRNVVSTPIAGLASTVRLILFVTSSLPSETFTVQVYVPAESGACQDTVSLEASVTNCPPVAVHENANSSPSESTAITISLLIPSAKTDVGVAVKLAIIGAIFFAISVGLSLSHVICVSNTNTRSKIKVALLNIKSSTTF